MLGGSDLGPSSDRIQSTLEAGTIGTDALALYINLRGRCSAFERSGTNSVAGAALWRGQVRISWQALQLSEDS